MEGGEAECLSDLKQLMMEMSEDSFRHHLKNKDFSNWIRDILHKDAFADQIENIHSKEDLIVAIDDELERDFLLGHDYSFFFRRFLAKNFIYGLVLGFILGVLLALLLVL